MLSFATRLVAFLILAGFLFAGSALAQNTDFNGDGKADMFWRNYEDGSNIIWLMDGPSRISAVKINTLNNFEWRLAGMGDFDGDGKTDILWCNTMDGRNLIWFMNGTTRKSEALIPSVDPSAKRHVAAVADFNGDSRADIFWRNSSGDNFIWMMDGGTRIDAKMIQSVIGPVWEPFAADFNGDGVADILWRGHVDGSHLVWLMSDGERVSAKLMNSMNNYEYELAGFGDFDGDGKDDIWWHNVFYGQNLIWFMDGGRRKAEATPPGEGWFLGDRAFVGTIDDFDGDNKADILWQNQGGDNFLWLMNGAKRTEAHKTFTVNDPRKLLGVQSYTSPVVQILDDFYLYEVSGFRSNEAAELLRANLHQDIIQSFVVDALGAKLTPWVDFSTTTIKVLTGLGVFTNVQLININNKSDDGIIKPVVFMSTGTSRSLIAPEGFTSPGTVKLNLHHDADRTKESWLFDDPIHTFTTGRAVQNLKMGKVYALVPRQGNGAKFEVVAEGIMLKDYGRFFLNIDTSILLNLTTSVHNFAVDFLQSTNNPVTLSSLSISNDSWQVNEGESLQLTATARWSDGTEIDVTSSTSWSESSSAVNSVSNGLVIAGQVTSDTLAGIRATYDDVSAVYTITVKDVSSPPPSQYTDNGNGTVTDNTTGLVWQQQDDYVRRYWNETVTYCNDLSLGGFSDWRIPNLVELQSLVDQSRYPLINPVFPMKFMDSYHPMNSMPYWTSQPSNEISWYGNETRWLIDFNEEHEPWAGDIIFDLFFARCVR